MLRSISSRKTINKMVNPRWGVQGEEYFNGDEEIPV
jgi:hypothetical protein